MTETLVFGATGQVGAEVVRALIELGVQPRVFSRDISKASALFADAATVFEGEFDDRAALRRALSGVSSVFLASPVDPRQVDWQLNVVEVAAEFNPLIVKLSGLATVPDSFVDSGRWHAETEALIRQRGLSHVFLHPMFFLQNLARSVPAALQTGELAAGSRDTRIAPVDVRDVGAVASELLTGRVDRTGSTLRLTTEETFTYEVLADLISELTGRTVSVRERSDSETRQMLLGTGMPDWHVAILLQFNRAFREGLGSQVSADVAEVIGRPPRSIRSYLQKIIDAREP